MATKEKKKEERISLLDIIAILTRHIKLIVIITAVAAVYIVFVNVSSMMAPAGSFFSFMPDVYKPTIRVLVDSSFGSQTTSSLSASSLGSMLGLGGTQKNSTVLLLEKIMQGNKIKDALAEASDLYGIYNLPVNPVTRGNMRKVIENKFKMEYNAAEVIGSPTAVLMLSYTDTNRELATSILKKGVELLNEEFKNITLDKVRTKKKYLQETIDMIEKDFVKAQQALIDFQSQYGADLKSLAQEQTNYIAQLQAEIYKQELLIRSLYLPENDPQVIQLRDQIRQKKQLINELKNGAGSFSKATVPLSEIPDLQRRYAKLEMEVKIQNELYTMMRQELEKAKIEEADTMPVFQLLDDFEVPIQKEGPKRGLSCIIFTLTAFVFSIFLAFVIEYFKKLKNNQQEYDKLRKIISSLNVFKRKRSQ